MQTATVLPSLSAIHVTTLNDALNNSTCLFLCYIRFTYDIL